jgi:hypothetical protein
MRRLALLGALLATLPLAAAEDGGQSVAWTKLALGARTAALGQAVSALAGDPSAALLNPALAAAQPLARASTQLALLPDGRMVQSLAFARPFWHESRAGWSLGYAQFGGGPDFERRRGNTGVPDSVFTESASQITLGLGAWVWERSVAAGAGVKVLSHALGDAAAGGVSADLGLFWRALPWLDLGFAARDLASRFGWTTGAYESQALDLRGAAAARFMDGRLQALAELQARSQQAPRPRLGLEAWPWARTLALRGGWNGADWTAGLGLHAPWRGLDWGLDYALGSDPLGPVFLQQRITLEIGTAL